MTLLEFTPVENRIFQSPNYVTVFHNAFQFFQVRQRGYVISLKIYAAQLIHNFLEVEKPEGKFEFRKPFHNYYTRFYHGLSTKVDEKCPEKLLASVLHGVLFLVTNELRFQSSPSLKSRSRSDVLVTYTNKQAELTLITIDKKKKIVDDSKLDVDNVDCYVEEGLIQCGLYANRRYLDKKL